MGCDGLVGFARFVLAGGHVSSALYLPLGIALWGVLGRVIVLG